ncbi:sodium:proton antiporter [Mycobacterium paraffinicum]|uniref:Sodium:proton antiporter n=1 Tax=Mycobacterium paraffinicum TaxID=53378 RepID=A0A1Q4HPR5_9MYCO|nr:cation:proton antiporter [Mycobacterium paraffinicum]OJZ69707.1 sodium:proton antiporter [Mycobacterium paraffinicum]
MALALLLAAVGAIVVTNWVSDRTGLPSAGLLTLVGIGYGLLPGPNVGLRPDIVMTCILPPLLYNAALESSLVGIRRNLRTVISLSVILVLLTAASVGAAFALLVTGATLAAGAVLGAAVAPTDPVAALAVARKVGLPLNIVTLIEGEGLLNDATALTTLSVAITVARGADFSFPFAVREFALAAVGGLVIGLAFAWCRRLLRRFPHDVMTANAISLATPFLAYLAAEQVHASGVLAVVVCGLVVGHDSPRSESGASRLQTRAVWRLANFLLEGLVFLLIGQQFPVILDGLRGYPVSTIVVATTVTTAAVLLVRPLWLLLTQSLPRSLHTRLGNVTGTGDDDDDDDDDPAQPNPGRDRNAERLSGREIFVLSWAGTRGVVSLAAIFAVPFTTDSGARFPVRDLLLFCTLVVVLVTLIGQGSTFGPVVRALGVHAKAVDEVRLRNRARTAAVRAALDALNELGHGSEADARAIDAVRRQLCARLERYQRRLDLLSDSDDLPEHPEYEAAVAIRRAAIDAERDELVRWRDAGMLPDRSLRVLERELDHEEVTLPTSRL